MSELEGFKHISVAKGEDDDVVIHAGVGTDDAPADGTGFKAKPHPAAATAPAPAATPAATLAEPAPEDAYRETTLDDLQAQPMSKTQKAVIACAVVALIVAVVYYLVFMH